MSELFAASAQQLVASNIVSLQLNPIFAGVRIRGQSSLKGFRVEQNLQAIFNFLTVFRLGMGRFSGPFCAGERFRARCKEPLQGSRSGWKLPELLKSGGNPVISAG